MTRKKTVIWLCVGLVSLGVGYAAWKRYQAKKDKKGDWVQVTQGDLISKFHEVGELEPKVKVDVKSNVTGRITRLFVLEGDNVKKGALLAIVQPGQTAAERYLPYAVRAPMAGTIIKRKAEVGDSVVSGLAEFGAGTILMTIGDLSGMVVKLDVNEVDIPKLSVHQKADVYLDAFPKETFSGVISFLSPLAELNDQKVKVFKAKVEILRPDPRLRPGMTSRVEVVLDRRSKVLKVPMEAIFEEGNKEVAYLVADNPKAAALVRPIKTGLKDEINAEILGGLKLGDKLSLTKPDQKLHASPS